MVFEGYAERLERFRALAQRLPSDASALAAVRRACLEIAREYQVDRVAVLAQHRLVQSCAPALVAHELELDRGWLGSIEQVLTRELPPFEARILAGATFGADARRARHLVRGRGPGQSGEDRRPGLRRARRGRKAPPEEAMNKRVLIGLGLACLACGEDEVLNDAGGVRPIDDYALAAPVEITLDAQKVPHLLAQSDLDAIYAQGHQQASDALFMLEMTRRSALGTLAEVLGTPGVEGDQQARTFGFGRLGAKSVALMRAKHPADHNLLVAYVAGINRRIAQVNAGEVPAPPELAKFQSEARALDPADALAIGIRVQLGFSSTLSFDLLYTLVNRMVEGAPSVPVFMTERCVHHGSGRNPGEVGRPTRVARKPTPPR